MVSARSVSVSEPEEQVNELTISCPSCGTSFQIQDPLFSGNRSPRFHCTVCDCIFIPNASEGNSEDEVEGVEGSALRSPYSTSTAQRYRPGSLRADGRSNDRPVNVNSDNNKTDNNRTDSLAPYEFPKGYPASRISSRPHETAEDDGEEISGKDIRSVGGRLFTIRKAEEPYALIGRPELRGRLTVNQTPLVRALRPFLIMFFCLTLLLALTTSLLTLNGDVGRVLEPILFRKGLTVPPAGLMIEDTHFRLLRLESGDDMVIISGKVANRTDRPFSMVQVEGLSFDAAGTLVGQGIALAGSELTAAQMKTLSPETVERLQLTPGSLADSLEPGAKLPFTVSLGVTEEGEGFGLSPKASAYYSARVYVVQ
jgi:hypothetical protein